MGQRRILVIGSQCEALPRLEFLPQAAQDLYAVMIDPHRGACVSAIDGAGLLIDLTVKDAKHAIRTAYQHAAKDGATLFIAYIGHGEHVKENFYLLPRNAKIPPTSDTAVHLTNLIMETHQIAAGQVDGLAVLVDACYAGLGGFSAAQSWVRELGGTLRFEMLTAAADRPAADGCFSRTLTRLLRDGIAAVPVEHLRCVDLRSRLEKCCPNQVPQHPAYNPDEVLWLAKNTGRIHEPWAQTPLADQIRGLTLAYQLTPDLLAVVARSQAERCVPVEGTAGSGKSALAAALAWPEATIEAVPAGFVQAVAFLTEATTAQELARLLAEQLGRSVPQFREAQQTFLRESPYSEQQRLGSLERQVVGPLGRLAPGSEVRLVMDGLERVATGARDAVMDALNDLARYPFVRLIVTSRSDTKLPAIASTPHVLVPPPKQKVAQYLEQRAIAQTRREEIIKAADGNWLVVRVLADLMGEYPDAEIETGKLRLGDAYEELLSRCSANEKTWHVLSIMAAGGAGPVLPLMLLCAASETLGGAATEAGLRDELFRLRGLVTRTAAGTEREHAGLFHQTLVEHVAARGPEAMLAAHRALADCIQLLAPRGRGTADLNDYIQRYAFEREAEHLWALGETDQSLKALTVRAAAAPRDNLRRWRLWEPRVESRFGADHVNTIETRHSVALWTGAAGDAREALRLYQSLLPDQIRVLGADHRDALRTRSNIAHWTGECVDAREALRLYHSLLADLTRVFGADWPGTLMVRSSIASLTGECGDVREALRLSQALLPDQTRVLGTDHQGTLTTRHNIASLIGERGDAREALRLLQALLPDWTRVLGADHPGTLTTRGDIASSTGWCGHAREALRLHQELLPDRTRVLGADHPDVLVTRSHIAYWTAKCAGAREALRLHQELLPDMTRVLGADHPATLTTRSDIASSTGECVDAREALRLSEALLLDETRVLGADHPATLRTRSNVAAWTGQLGDVRQALRLFEALLPDMTRVLGADHPNTLNACSWVQNLDQWNAKS